MQTAEEQLYQALDEALVQQDDHLMIPMTKLNQAIGGLFEQNTKAIARIQDRIIRRIDREATKTSDNMDVALTRVLDAMNIWQEEVHYILTQIAAKGGMTKAGEPLESAILQDLAEAPQLAMGSTLILEISRMTPYFEQLIAVLKEIRDAIRPNLVRVKGEPEEDDAEEPSEAAAQADESELEATPITWDEV